MEPTPATRTEREMRGRLLMEIGLVTIGVGDAVDKAAIRAVHADLEELFQTQFPEFEWQFPLVQLPVPFASGRVEPVQLLQYGVDERDSHNWDMVILITESDLVTHYKPSAFAVTSRLQDVAAISTARIDPNVYGDFVAADVREATLRRRLIALLLHSIGHLAGLSHAHDEEANVMREIRHVEELDVATGYSEEQRAEMKTMLRDIADQRLEEEAQAVEGNTLWFYACTYWANRRKIWNAVKHAEPWEFPRRLGRLTTAALSTLVILLNTAESWDLALTQPLYRSLSFMAFVLVVTTCWILHRQGLLVYREHRRLTEQRVGSNIVATLIVFGGQLTMAGVLFATAMLAEYALFSPTLIDAWASSVEIETTHRHYFKMGLFVTAMGLVIGSLGASFEEHHYFKHITFIDEEE